MAGGRASTGNCHKKNDKIAIVNWRILNQFENKFEYPHLQFTYDSRIGPCNSEVVIEKIISSSRDASQGQRCAKSGWITIARYTNL